MYWKSVTPFHGCDTDLHQILYASHISSQLAVGSIKTFPVPLLWTMTECIHIAATDSDIIQVDFKILTKSLHKESKLLLPTHIMTCNYNCYIAHSSYSIAWHVPHLKKT